MTRKVNPTSLARKIFHSDGNELKNIKKKKWVIPWRAPSNVDD